MMPEGGMEAVFGSSSPLMVSVEVNDLNLDIERKLSSALSIPPGRWWQLP